MIDSTSSIFIRCKSHFANWREWELNPIVIKELRQAVRSWAVTGMLLLFLAVLFIAAVGFLVTQSFDVDANMELGGTMFSTFAVILAGASILFIPMYVGVRVAAERVDNNPDLLYVSTLSPARIIRGKFLCGAYMTALFFSACMPFMAFTNLLRGVDLPTVFFILTFLYLAVCGLNMVAIFFACLPLSRPFKILFALGGFIASFFVIGSLISISFIMMRSGIGSMIMGHDFWLAVLTWVGIGTFIVGLFYVLAVALISPPSANRALPVRIYLTAIWLLFGLLVLGWIIHMGTADAMQWAYPTFIVMLMALLVVVSNGDELSLRVRRTIPRSPWKRLVAFFFFNGAAGGLLWVATILTATFFAVKAMIGFVPGGMVPSIVSEEGGLYPVTFAAYAFGYALTALFIHRKFFPHRTPKFAGILTVILAGGWALVPSIVMFFLNRLSWNSVESFQPGNMFNVFSGRGDGLWVYHAIFAFGWLAVMTLLNVKWFVRQWRNFQPLNPVETPPPVLK